MSDTNLEWIRSRLRRLDAKKIELGETRRAAVALIARERPGDDFDILFIKRAEDPRDPWSGHMALPGGRVESGEATQVAAERETFEEVGIDLARAAESVGRLDDINAVARGRRIPMIISPFVYVLSKPDVTLSPNHEVAKTLWVPASRLREARVQSTLPYEHEGKHYSLPCFRVQGEVVWGLTYKMLMSFFVAVSWQLPSERRALIAS